VTGGPWLELALVVPPDADRPGDLLRRRVIEHELRRRLGDLGCRWTTADRVVAEPRPDVVVLVGVDLAPTAWGATTPPPLVEAGLATDGGPTDPVRHVPTVIDPTTWEVRTRMLRHLGLLPEGPYTVAGPPWRTRTGPDAAPTDLSSLHLTPTDLATLVAHAERAELDDAGLAALVGGRGEVPTGTDAAAIAADVDDLATRITGALDGADTATTAQRIARLERELAELRAGLEAASRTRRAERARAIAALDEAADRERVLRAQLEAAELEVERLAVDRATTAAAASSPADRRR
jgi:hypothetical protein